VLIFTFSLLASSLSLLSPAPFVLLVLFVFVNDETFSNSFGCLFIVVFLFILFTRVVVVRAAVGPALIALTIIVINKLVLVLVIIQKGLPHD
jgi:hypothetical protein